VTAYDPRQAPPWISDALRDAAPGSTDRRALRAVDRHLGYTLGTIADRLDAGLWPGVDREIPADDLARLRADVDAARRWWSDRDTVAGSAYRDVVAASYRIPHNYGTKSHARVVAIARRDGHDRCPTCGASWL